MSPLDGIRNLLASHTEMSSSRGYPPIQGYPDVPSSLAAGDYELRDYNQDPPPAAYPPPPSNTAPTHTPYLGLQSRLSQVWLNRWTVLLLLIVVRLLLATSDIRYDLSRAETEALSACSSVENVGSAMASMPHYLSDGVNALAADGMSKAVNGLGTMLMLALTGVQEIVTFIINLLTSTYVCLITLAVSGSLQTQIKMIEEVGDFFEEKINSLTGNMSDDLNSFADSLNKFLSKINIGGILGSNNPPRIDLTNQIEDLKNIKVDTSKMDAELSKLNASIPTFDEVQNFTNRIIALPFEHVKQLVNDSFANYTFDRSIFPAAQKQQLTFCSDNDGINDFFDSLNHIVVKARKIFLALLILGAILVCIPMAYREIWRWRNMQSRAQLLQRQSFDPMDVIYIASRPITTTLGIRLSSKVGGSTKRQILTRWLVAYATSLPALFVLALGFAGLFSCLCQYIILAAIKKEVPSLIARVSSFADKVVTALDSASTSWARSANAVIADTSNKINDDVFGWVNTSTVAVNDTLTAFSDTMTTALNDTFGGTVLYKPVTGVFNCLVELKVRGIQKGLTWVHDHAHVSLPDFRPDVFSLGAAASVAGNDSDAGSFLSSPGNETSDAISGAVVRAVNKFEDMIAEEAIISACLIGIWVLLVLIGLARVVYSVNKRDKTRAEGGPSYATTSAYGMNGGMYPPQSQAGFAHMRGNLGMAVHENRTARDGGVGAQGGTGHGIGLYERSPRYEDDGWGDVGLGDGEGILAGEMGDEKVREGSVAKEIGREVGHERKSSHGYVGGVKG